VILISYGKGVHVFELRQPGPETRAVIEQTLAFMRHWATSALDARDISLSSAAAHGYQRRWNEAVTAYRALRASEPKNADVAEKLGEALAATGHLRGALAEKEAAAKLNAFNLGLISHAAAVAALQLGDKDLALEWLARLKDIPPMKSRVMADPALSPLRSDPRFIALMSSPSDHAGADR